MTFQSSARGLPGPPALNRVVAAAARAEPESVRPGASLTSLAAPTLPWMRPSLAMRTPPVRRGLSGASGRPAVCRVGEGRGGGRGRARCLMGLREMGGGVEEGRIWRRRSVTRIRSARVRDHLIA